jgi:2-C-methyl-D-erythritol 4-phosphate cytidylyltransferase
MKTYVVLLGAGVGERIGSDLPKQLLRISGKTVLEHSVEVFEKHKCIDGIVVVLSEKILGPAKAILQNDSHEKIIKIVVGGATRQESSRIGINAIDEVEAKVLIHDVVRPLVTDRIISECVSALDRHNAVDVAIPASDTVIEVGSDMLISGIPARRSLMCGQTPQAFKLTTIRRAHELAGGKPNLQVTDDCGLVQAFDLAKIHVIAGDETNVKITYPIDVFVADKLFQLKHLVASDADLKQLRDKVLVILGASSGIGKSISGMAKTHGARVYDFSRQNEVDVRSRSAIEKALHTVHTQEGQINFVINTAGIMRIGELRSRAASDLRDEIETNYFGCVNIAQASYEYLKETAGMLIFFTSSSFTRGRAMNAVYSSTKAAVVNLTQALAEEWSQDGIKINAMNPERTATPLRLSNFGQEPAESLLTPDLVAEKTLQTLFQDYTGQVVDIRR